MKQRHSAYRSPSPLAKAQRVTLARALSKLGYCSRTQAEKLILERKVSVDRHIVDDPDAWVDLKQAVIAVNGVTVAAQESLYLMLNKPRGLVTTRHDPQGRPTVYQCLGDRDDVHLSPVGRLDKASEGLLLFTNDTQFAHRLLDPETHLAKTYHVQIDKIADEPLIQQLRGGVQHNDEWLKVISVEIVRTGTHNSWLEIKLDEGRNRHIRRMLEALDIACLRLIRVAIGDLVLGELPKGAVRSLTSTELQALQNKTNKTGP